MKYNNWILENGDRIIVTYSSKRATKDAYNCNKGVEWLRKAHASGKINKDKINKRGYSKFLKLDNDNNVSLSKDTIKIAKTITTIRFRLPLNNEIFRTMLLTPEHRSLIPLLDYLGVLQPLKGVPELVLTYQQAFPDNDSSC